MIPPEVVENREEPKTVKELPHPPLLLSPVKPSSEKKTFMNILMLLIEHHGYYDTC